MSTALSKFDEMFLHYLQEAYLWLFDRTGIYVGSVMVANAALITCIGLQKDYGMAWRILCCVIGLMFLAMSFARWHMQLTMSNSAYNSYSLIQRESSVRFYLTFFWVFVIALDIITLDFSGTVFDFALWLNNSFGAILIRDREPKDWITFGKMAPQGNA